MLHDTLAKVRVQVIYIYMSPASYYLKGYYPACHDICLRKPFSPRWSTILKNLKIFFPVFFIKSGYKFSFSSLYGYSLYSIFFPKCPFSFRYFLLAPKFTHLHRLTHYFVCSHKKSLDGAFLFAFLFCVPKLDNNCLFRSTDHALICCFWWLTSFIIYLSFYYFIYRPHLIL